MKKLPASRGFINCPTSWTKREVWPLHNVLRTLSSIWHSLLVEILMWRSFRIVFSPKAVCRWEKKMEVSRKLIPNAFCKRWQATHFVAWGESSAVSRTHHQSLTRPSKAFLADRRQHPYKESSPLCVPGLKAFSDLEGGCSWRIFITGLSFRYREMYFQLQFSFRLLMRLDSPSADVFSKGIEPPLSLQS